MKDVKLAGVRGRPCKTRVKRKKKKNAANVSDRRELVSLAVQYPHDSSHVNIPTTDTIGVVRNALRGERSNPNNHTPKYRFHKKGHLNHAVSIN